MNDAGDLVHQLLDSVQQRMETKVLERLRASSDATRGIATLIDEVCAEETLELKALAEKAKTEGQEVQAQMYRLMESDLLPQAAANLRDRLRQN